MKISIFHRLVRCMGTSVFLYCFLVFLSEDVNWVLAKPESRTKLLLQNIRTHLAQKVDEVVQQKECQSGLTFCKNAKKDDEKEEGDEEKNEEIPPAPKVVRGHHKPLIKVNSKEIIHTMMPKVHKMFTKKSTKGERRRNFSPLKKIEITSSEESEEDEEKEKKPEKEINKKTEKIIPKLVKFEKPVKPVKPISEKKDTYHKILDKPKVITPELSLKPLEIRKDIKREIGKKKMIKEYEDKKDVIIKEKLRIVKEDLEIETQSQKLDKLEGFLIAKGSFLYVLDSEDVKNDLCRKHSQIYLNQLQKYKIWALMMFDASAKLPSGILQGNINQLGDFDECLAVNAIFKNPEIKFKEPSGIRGKYCLANIDVSTNTENKGLQQASQRAESFSFVKSSIYDPGHFIPKFTTINWGLCVPSECPAEDVENYMKSQMKIFNETSGLLFDVLVEKDNCVRKEDLKFEYDQTTTAVVFFYLIIIFTAVYATYADFKKENKEQVKAKEIFSEGLLTKDTEDKRFSLKENFIKVIMAFSFKRNLRRLFSDNDSTNSINCIYGIKSIFTITLYFAHKIIPLGMTPFSNRIFLTMISNEASTTILRASIIYTDSFLLISGVLISYNLFKEVNEKGEISWAKKSLARFIRLTPSLFAVLLFYAYVWNHLGSGPLWNQVVKTNSDLCQKYMWRNLLYIQNFFAFEKMCAPQTHQLALDMQLSLLAPLFVHLLYKYDKVGIGILQALFLFSSIMRYTSTANNHLSIVIYHGMPVSQLYRTANLLYGQALHRASPYILGTILGYYLKKYEKKINIPKAFVALGWIIAFSFGFYSMVTPAHLAMRSYKYDVEESAQYAALSPVAWSLALGWLIAACHLGYGGKLNEFLCRKSLLVFSRISYSIYLTQFLVFFYKVGVKRVPEMFTFTGSINIMEFFIVLGISVIVTLLFDTPMIDIKKIILDEGSKKRVQQNEEIGDHQIPEDNFQEEKDIISLEESQENTKEIDYVEEKEYETEVREVDEYEENIIEEDEEGKEEYDDEEEMREEDEYDDEEEEEDIEDEDDEDVEKIDYNDRDVEDYEMQPLRRSTRILFDDESEDKEWFKIEDVDEDEEKIE